MAATDAVLDDEPTARPAPDGQQPASYAQAKLADMVFRVAFMARLCGLAIRDNLTSGHPLQLPFKYLLNHAK